MYLRDSWCVLTVYGVDCCLLFLGMYVTLRLSKFSLKHYLLTYLLRHLHWLAYQFQTLYNNIQSAWLWSSSISCTFSPQLYSLPRTMHPSSTKLLTVPRHNLSLGSRAFRISAPTTWNSLPHNAREFSSLASFQSHLKTHYFSSAFSALWHLTDMRLILT